jgi:hypothetical protein
MNVSEARRLKMLEDENAKLKRLLAVAVGFTRRERDTMPIPPLLVSPSVIEVELASRLPCDRIGDPAIDVGFPPASAVDADLDPRRKRALGDLAVDGRPGQAGAGENGFHADDTVWCEHGCAASGRVFLTASGTRQSEDLLLRKSDLGVVALWRRGG